MLRNLIFAAAFIIAAFTSGPSYAIGPSFLCAKAVGRPMGELICASPDLSRLDLEFAQAYYALRYQVGPSGQQALEVQAINFENKAIADCQIPTSDPAPPLTSTISDCITREYEAQRQAWLALLTGPALEEANLPVEQLIALQGDLRALGYLPANAAIDGVYGAGTRAAITAWQTAKGQEINGFMGDAAASELVTEASATASGTATQSNNQQSNGATESVTEQNQPQPPVATENNSKRSHDWYSAESDSVLPGASVTCRDTTQYPVHFGDFGLSLPASPNGIISQFQSLGANMSVQKINDASGNLADVIIRLSNNPTAFDGTITLYTSMANCVADNPPAPAPAPPDPSLK